MNRKEVTCLILAVIPLDKIIVPENRLSSRLDPEQQQGLVDSIERLGLINPVSVKETDGQYLLIAGFNRVVALHQLGKKTVPAFIYSDSQTPVRELNICENLHRGSTNPIDEALSIKDLLPFYGSNLEKCAQAIGRSTLWVKGRLELLSLPDDLQDDLSAKRLSIAVCTQLAYVQDFNLRRQIATRAIDYSASAKTAKQWVDTIMGTPLPTQTQEREQLLKDASNTHLDVSLECASCHTKQPPFNFTSEFICCLCKAKLSSQTGAGQTAGTPGTSLP